MIGLFAAVAVGLLAVIAVFTANVLVWQRVLGRSVTVAVDGCNNTGCADREVVGPDPGKDVQDLPHNRPLHRDVQAREWGGDAVIGVPWGSIVADGVVVIIVGAVVSASVRKHRSRRPAF